jgi:hypothetical protein
VIGFLTYDIYVFKQELYTSVLLATAPSATFGATGGGRDGGGAAAAGSEFEHYERLTAAMAKLETDFERPLRMLYTITREYLVNNAELLTMLRGEGEAGGAEAGADASTRAGLDLSGTLGDSLRCLAFRLNFNHYYERHSGAQVREK